MHQECRERFPPLVSDPDMHQGTCVMQVPWCMPESLTGGFLWSRWQGKRSTHFRRMRNPQFYVSGKRHVNIGVVDEYILNMSKAKGRRVFCSYAWPQTHRYCRETKYIFTITENNFVPGHVKIDIFSSAMQHGKTTAIPLGYVISYEYPNGDQFATALSYRSFRTSLWHQGITRWWSLPFAFCFIWYEEARISTKYIRFEYCYWARSNWFAGCTHISDTNNETPPPLPVHLVRDIWLYPAAIP